MRPYITSLGVLGMLALTGCAQPAPENETACRLFVDAENEVMAAINEWIEMGGPEGGTARAREAGDQRRADVPVAAAIATGKVGDAMRQAASLVSATDEDSMVAYQLLLEDVFEACRAEGVRLNVVEHVD